MSKKGTISLTVPRESREIVPDRNELMKHDKLAENTEQAIDRLPCVRKQENHACQVRIAQNICLYMYCFMAKLDHQIHLCVAYN